MDIEDEKSDLAYYIANAIGTLWTVTSVLLGAYCK